VADLGSATPEIGLQLFYNGSFLSNQNSNQFFTQNGYYDTAANGSQTPANPSVSAIGIMFDYQPNFLKFFGIFDFGVSGAINPIFPTPNNTVTGLLAGATVGGQIRYQLNYFKNQPLIPIVGYFADWMTYGFTALNTSNQTINGAIVVKGPLVGAWLLLNWIEPSSSRDMYLNTGISRTYFTFEMRQMSGSSGTLTITGQTYLFGLRFEF
jgi:hypothetical protein